MTTIVQEKLAQAVALLHELDIDAWVTFARETSQTPDPALDLILGFGLTWDSALIVTRSREMIAIVGHYDGDNVVKLGAYDTVLRHHTGINAQLRETIARLDPRTIALNYSTSDSAADGLTHGMWIKLCQLLGAERTNSFVSAEPVVRRLRERKSPAEVARVRESVARTESFFERVLDLPLAGMTEIQIHTIAGDIAASLDSTLGWDRATCPIVNAGPESSIGHGMPAHIALKPGMILHIDVGLTHADYSSDLQRSMYVLQAGETSAPEDVRRAFDACRAAIEAGRAALKPGVAGWTVDQAARASLTAAGYPEFMHAFGHHVGRKVHDGGGLLGPRWEKYGNLPNTPVERDSIYAIELGVELPGRGYLGLEENVLVGDAGAEYLCAPQTELILLHA